MPWVRIDENALTHLKVRALSNGSFRLWVEGLAHCQRHLTDGVISRTALRTFIYASRSRVDELTTSVDGAAPLWEIRPDGFLVHDYLAWNESRDHVLKAREFAKKRIKKLREKRVTNVDGNGDRNAGCNALHVGEVTRSSLSGVVCSGTSSGIGESARGVRGPSNYSDAINQRAGVFCSEIYPALYAKHRKGARYLGKPALDYQEALQLCATWDDERLTKLATVFLTTDHEFAEKGSRTMAQFRSLASWCDGKLREAGL